MNVLLVDDEKSFHNILKILSKQNRFTPFVCSDLDELKSIIKNHTINIALIDVNLPTCTGEDIIKYLRAHSKNTICYLFTSDLSILNSYLKMVDGYIEKDKLVIKLPTILQKTNRT